MNAEEFNVIYDKTFVQALVAAGFVRRRTNLFFFEDSGVLAVIRHANKWSSLAQTTLLTVCVRHRLLRNLDKGPCDQFAESINDYPFKIQPSKMSLDFFNDGWHYIPCNLGHWPEEKIEFGKDFGGVAKIESIRNAILSSGQKWLKFLKPQEAYNQILKYGESAYCEKIWLEDYKIHIGGQ
jgi:hypothetical protein